jgi:hypothetical protein
MDIDLQKVIGYVTLNLFQKPLFIADLVTKATGHSIMAGSDVVRAGD